MGTSLAWNRLVLFVVFVNLDFVGLDVVCGFWFCSCCWVCRCYRFLSFVFGWFGVVRVIVVWVLVLCLIDCIWLILWCSRGGCLASLFGCCITLVLGFGG